MAQAGQVYKVRTNSAVDFLGTIAQNFSSQLNINAPQSLAAGKTTRFRLKAISLISVQNLDWEIWLWGTSAFHGGAAVADMNLQYPAGFWSFGAGDAKRVSPLDANSYYYYYVDGLDVPYQDFDFSGQIHLELVNRNGTTKAANAAGALVVELVCELTTGY